jgi:hypothetical protein
MTSTPSPNAPGADLAPRHFYYSRYLCVTNILLCGLGLYGAISGQPKGGAVVALIFVAWSFVCFRELIMRKPAITVSTEGIVIRKLIFAGANMKFDDIEQITMTRLFGCNRFNFKPKSVGTASPYQIVIYNNQHLNCAIESEELVEAIHAARPGINFMVD